MSPKMVKQPLIVFLVLVALTSSKALIYWGWGESVYRQIFNILIYVAAAIVFLLVFVREWALPRVRERRERLNGKN